MCFVGRGSCPLFTALRLDQSFSYVVPIGKASILVGRMVFLFDNGASQLHTSASHRLPGLAPVGSRCDGSATVPLKRSALMRFWRAVAEFIGGESSQ